MAKEAFAGLKTGISRTFSFAKGQFTDIVAKGKEFEQAMLSASSGFGGLDSSGLKEAQKAVLDIGKTTEFTANEAAAGLKAMADKGWDATESLKMLPAVTNLATASQTDLSTAVSQSHDVLGYFNKDLEDLPGILDAAAKVSSDTQTGLNVLFETMKEGGSAFDKAGQSVESFTALTGKLAEAGTRGADAGNHLKTIISTLSAPAEEAGKKLEKMGISLKDGDSFKDIIQVIGEFETKMKGMTEAQKKADLKAFFGKDAAESFFNLMNEGAVSLTTYKKELNSASGSLVKMSDIMRNSLENRIKILQSQFNNIKLNAFILLEPLLKKIVSETEKLVSSFLDWIKINEEGVKNSIEKLCQGVKTLFDVVIKLGRFLISDFGKTVLIIVGTFIAFYKALILAKSIITLVPIIKTVALAFKFLTAALISNPIILIITAIIAVGILLWRNWDTVCKAVGAALSWLGDKAKAFGQWFMSIPNSVLAAIPVFGPLLALIQSVAKNWDSVKEGFKRFIDLFKNLPKVLGTAKASFIEWVDQIPELIDSLPEKVSKGIGNLMRSFKIPDSFKEEWEGIVTFVESIVNQIVSTVITMGKAVLNPIGFVKDLFSDTRSEHNVRHSLDDTGLYRTSNSLVMEKNSTSKTLVDLNINGAPNGSAAVVTGESEGVTVNMGSQMFLRGAVS